MRLALAVDREGDFFRGPGGGWGGLGCELAEFPCGGNRREWERFLRDFNPEILVSGWGTPPLPTEWIEDSGCALRYVCHLTGSVRPVLPRVFLERGGLASNWGDLAGKAVAEHALLLALAALRNLPAWAAARTEAGKPGTPARVGARTLFGRRTGIHGFGSVARSLLALLEPFGGEIAAYTGGLPAEALRAAGARPCASLRELCARSDVLFECEGLTEETRCGLGAAELAALPDGAVLVNVGRGGVIAEEAMLAEAATGRIRLALDVVTDEPPAPDHPLHGFSDVVWSPHIAGPTPDQYSRCGEKALANVRRYLAGEPVESVITLAAYDRST